MRLPEILNPENMAPVGILHASKCSVDLSLKSVSTARAEMPIDHTVGFGTWVRIYYPNGETGVYRASIPENDYDVNKATVTFDHGSKTLADNIVNVGDTEDENGVSQPTYFEGNVTAVFNRMLGYQKKVFWQMGIVESNDNMKVEVDFDNLLSLMNDSMQQIPEYYIEYDQSSFPWKVNIRRYPTVVTSEGRLSRNVRTAKVRYDDSDLVTRVYCEALNSKYLDSPNINQYGIREGHNYLNNVENDYAVKACRMYLESRDKPKVNVTVEGADFSEITGVSLDKIRLGDLYRLVIPERNVTVEEQITGINYTDICNRPYELTVTLAHERDDLSSALAAVRSRASSNSHASQKAASKVYHVYEKLKKEAIVNVNQVKVLHEAGIEYDENGVMLYAKELGIDGTERLSGVLKVQAERLTSDYSNKIAGTESHITQTASQIRAEVKSTKEGLESSITQTAGQIRAEVSETAAGLSSSITQTAERIELNIQNTKEGLESTIEQTDKSIRLHVGDVEEGLKGEIQVERDRVGLVVEGTGENAKIKPASIVASINKATKESSVLISADRISLAGTTTIDDTMTVQNGNLLVKYAALFGTTAGSQVSINNGSVNAKTLQVNSGGKMVFVGSGGGEYYNITTSVLQGMIKSASVSGNVLTLTPFYGDAITFSKATSLSGGWSSVDGVNKYRVTAKQNGVTVATHDYDPPMRLNGTTAASNFSAEITETSGSTTTGKKSIYGYLVKGGSGSSSYVDVNTAYDGTGTSVARLGVGSVYTSGQNNVAITKGTWNGGKIDFTKSAGTASTKSVSLVGGTPTADQSTVYIEIWDGESADVYHGSKTGYTATASLQTKSVTSNGDVTPDSGYVGLSKVTVDVPSGGSPASAIQIDSSTWYNSSDPAPAYDANLSNTGRLIAKNKVGYVYFRAYVQDGSGEKWYRIPIDTR